ncbi:MAG TPA: DUF2911 domain-containing protein [Gemmatimonadaceae bacterium]|nr:DUF2911 domain-containing protein [Gemmatimonadaceae bacterium]
MRPPTIRTRVALPHGVLGAAIWLAVPVSLAAAQARASSPAPSRGAFVITLGNDTVGVEQFTRSANRLEGDIIQRGRATSVGHYVITTNPDGTARTFTYTVHRADGTAPPNAIRSASVSYGPDTAVTTIVRDSSITMRTAARGAFPYLGSAFGPYELFLSRLRASRPPTDSGSVTLLPPGAQSTLEFPVKFVGGDTVRVWYFGSPQIVLLDRQGRITSVDATHTTEKFRTIRLPSVNIDALAAAFAKEDASGRAIGAQMSPRDTARASVGAANIFVDYGRPALRGRDVWQHGVLGDTIWRTGANAATQFSTSADLVVKGVTVPAGKYTLWTHTTPTGYELIFNKQTGQWGTDYDPAQDLVRIPLDVATAPAPEERFTVTVEQAGAGGVMRLAWGPKVLSLPFIVK